jgi:Replication-relaxation
MKQAKAFRLVTPQMEQVLKAVHFYRYMTASDITNLFYSPRSITYVRELLSDMCGMSDFVTHQLLFRFRLPSIGNSERVYTLGSRGRDYVAQELGLPVSWYFRPHKMANVGYSHIVHHALLTRVLVAAESWSTRPSAFKLSNVRICYELGERPATVTITQEGRPRALKVIPDAWLLFRRVSDGKRFPILLELDRGTQFQNKFKEHVRSRIEYIRSGAYEKTFGTNAVLIAYATTGATPAIAESRRSTISAWSNEVLGDLGIKNWASIFRFHALPTHDIYNGAFFEEKVWYRADRPAPTVLFGS